MTASHAVLAEFSAEVFYRELGLVGHQPYVFDEGQKYSFLVDSLDRNRTDELWAWAGQMDPDNAQRKSFAQQRWANRAEGETRVSLC